MENEHNDRKNPRENGGDLKLPFVFAFVFTLRHEDHDKTAKFTVTSCLLKVEHLYRVVTEVIPKASSLKHSSKPVSKMGSVK